MDMQTLTILEHLEAIRDRADDAPDCACSVCLSARDAAAALHDVTEIENLIAAIRDSFDADYPSDPRSNAVAALALLRPDPVAAATPPDVEPITGTMAETIAANDSPSGT